MAKYLYDDYIVTLSQRFDAALDEIKAEFNFDYGDEFEIAICGVLRRALPQKYGICRGFVVDEQGNTAGDDIVIYDRARFPTLRALGNEKYDRKEFIPIEAVYAYIEAKHGLSLTGGGDSSITHAAQQVSDVKKLCSKRKPVDGYQIRPYFAFNQNIPASTSSPPGFPVIQNPIFGMVLARRVREKAGGKVIDSEESKDVLINFQFTSDYPPDAYVLGKDLTIIPVRQFGPTNYEIGSPFYVPGYSTSIMKSSHGLGIGVALSLLLFALDWIQLGEMEWKHIIGNALGATLPEKTKN